MDPLGAVKGKFFKGGGDEEVTFLACFVWGHGIDDVEILEHSSEVAFVCPYLGAIKDDRFY